MHLSLFEQHLSKHIKISLSTLSFIHWALQTFLRKSFCFAERRVTTNLVNNLTEFCLPDVNIQNSFIYFKIYFIMFLFVRVYFTKLFSPCKKIFDKTITYSYTFKFISLMLPQVSYLCANFLCFLPCVSCQKINNYVWRKHWMQILMKLTLSLHATTL